MNMESCGRLVFKINKHIRMFCLLLTVLKVNETFSQAYFCSGKVKSIDKCLEKMGVFNEKIKAMPVNLEELDASCEIFSNGMKCINDYALYCLEEDKREPVLSHFKPTVNMMQQLCHNHNLRQDFLKHPKCHDAMRPEWGRCSNQFISLVHDQNLNDTNYSEEKIFEICCAKLRFLDCINHASCLKCVPEAAIMHRDIAANLNGMNVEQYNCTSYVNATVCNATNYNVIMDKCSRSYRNSSSFPQVIGLFLMCILLYSWRK